MHAGIRASWIFFTGDHGHRIRLCLATTIRGVAAGVRRSAGSGRRTGCGDRARRKYLRAGLAAKPIIDCDIVVAQADVDAASAMLMNLEFEPLGELGIPQRWAFKEPARLAGTNTYVVVQGSLSLRNHLCVRDVLRRNTALRDEYASVKKRIGAEAMDIDEYGKGKNTMVQRILAAGGMSDADRASVDGNQVPSHIEVPR